MLRALGALVATVLTACQRASPRPGEATSRDVVTFDVSAMSYLDHQVFEIRLNGIEVGLGGGALMTGVDVPLGPQVVTWRLASNGGKVRAVNQPILAKPDPTLRYLGVHIYPDSTVELIPEAFWPERTERGKAYLRARENITRP